MAFHWRTAIGVMLSASATFCGEPKNSRTSEVNMMWANVSMLTPNVKHAGADFSLRYPQMDTMGKRIRTLRLSREWTQSQLAERLGVTRGAVSQWELGDTANIKIATYLTLCQVLGTTPEYLAFGPDGGERDRQGRFGRGRK